MRIARWSRLASSFSVKGLGGLQASLARVVSASNAAARRVVSDEVRAVDRDASGFAPVDSGELVDGIVGRANGLDGEVEATARHSVFVEGGTYKDDPQPFMAPAAEASRVRFPRAAATAIGLAARSVSSGGR